MFHYSLKRLKKIFFFAFCSHLNNAKPSSLLLIQYVCGLFDVQWLLHTKAVFVSVIM